ncbi:MAG: COG3014 family protein [Planctomycetaceae bacterium]
MAIAGCSTYSDRLRDVRTEFHSGDLAAAEKFIAQELPKRRRAKEADVLQLERAMIELSSGKPASAERTLRGVRDRFDFLEQKDLAEGVASYLTDDTHRAYAGEDYEKVLIRAFLALSNLMHDGGDANAYALQVNDKQRQIIEAAGNDADKNPKLSYKRVALGAYVSGMLRESTLRDYDDAQRSIQLVANWEPEFASARQDLERVTNGRHSAPGHGVLYVFTLVGRGPYKEERNEIPTQAAMLIVDHILSAVGKHSVTPTFAPVKVPVVVVPPNRVQSVIVAIDGKPAGLTETITDVGELATQQYAAIFPRVLARTVVRRTIKKGSLYAAKEVGQVSHPLAELAIDAAGVAWEATENADTRCWGLLPNKIQVRRIELPAGKHLVALQPASANGQPLGGTQQTELQISDARNTYVLANFPGTSMVGKLLVNQEAAGGSLPDEYKYGEGKCWPKTVTPGDFPEPPSNEMP